MKTTNTKSILWQLFLVLLPIPITVWLTIQATNQPDNINYLTYYTNENTDFISIPDEIEEKVGIIYNDEAIENLSVVRFYIFNSTNRNLSNIQLHFEIQSDDREYTLISNSLYGPDDYPKEGVHPLKSEDANIYIYKVDSINRDDKSDSSFFGKSIILSDTFVAEFVFLGSELPKIKISTSNTGIKIRDVNETSESDTSNMFDTILWYVSINWRLFTFLIIIVPIIIIYAPYSEKVERHYIRKLLKQYLESLGKVELSDLHIENIVKTADQLYKKYIFGWEGIIAPIKALIKKEKLDE